MSAPTLNHRLAAILAADVVGYSKHIAQDEQATIAALELARDAFRVKVGEFRGRIVDMSGDAVLACFGASTDAVSSAIAIQSELSKTNNILHFRVGISTGDVIEKPDGTVYGNGVNIAARLESISNPQGICIDGATYSIVNGKVSVGYAYLGEQALKNVDHPVEAYRVLSDSHFIGKTIVEAGPKRAADRPVICFIDDDPQELAIFTRVFGNDFRILAGTRFVEAKEKFAEAARSPHLFLLDLYFPTGRDSTPEERSEMARLKGEVEAAQARLNAYLAQIGQDRSGGLRLLSQVRREFPDTPIVFYTRKGTLEDVNACLEEGAAAVLKKPQPSALDPARDIHSQLESAALASKNSILTKLEAILASKPASGLLSRVFKR